MITAALIGNPNSGKTTVFNKLTGSIQHVGNWPGVTVERKQGYIRNTSKDRILVVDLPGVYSLSPYSPEEIVSRDYLIGTQESKPDVAINIVDASNMERALYLLLQVADLGIPMVVVLNMVDIAEKNGMRVDSRELAESLGCEVVETIGIRNMGTSEIGEAVQRAYDSKKVPKTITYSESLERCISDVQAIIAPQVRDGLERWCAIKMIERDEMVVNDLDADVVEKANEVISAFERESSDDGVQIVATERYDAAERIEKSCMHRFEEKKRKDVSISDKIDNILLNRVLGIPIFLAVMLAVYYISIQTVGTWGSDWINDNATAWLQDTVRDALTDANVSTALTGLIVDGIIAGVFAVLGFLPQIIVLFLCLSILEECGYMSRVAYLLDRLFCRFGLSGKTVIPVVIGMGCGVPAIMGSRTIEDEQTRRITAMTTTFVPCSAKLPIITIIIAAFFHESAIVALSMYVLGICMILMSGIILKKFSGVTGKPSPFVMELPVYHAPTCRNVLTNTGEKSWSFVKKAGTFILLSCVIVWFLCSYDWGLGFIGSNETDGSMLADIGGAITNLFALQGFGNHWELTVSSITGLLAKENLLGTLAILVDPSGMATDEEGLLTAAGLAAFCTSGEAMAFLIFNLLCAPCFAAIGAMRRELGTWKATGFAVLYQCILAWCASLVFYQLWRIVHGMFDPIGFVIAVAVCCVYGYFLVAKDPVGAIRKNMEKVKAGGAAE